MSDTFPHSATCACVRCVDAVLDSDAAALAAAEALEARYARGIQAALATLHAAHAALPDGDDVPRQSVDGLALLMEGALLAVLKGVARE